MERQELSLQLRKLLKPYQWHKDTEGMSPARVYKLVGEQQNLYLKMTHAQYDGTTYDVEREKNMMLWLKGKLPVPEVLHFEQYGDWRYLLMSEVAGQMAYEAQQNPQKMVALYAECIQRLQAIDITDCPYNNNAASRLAELEYLLQRNLADIDSENWEEDTPFQTPAELVAFLHGNQPQEELVFSHGDLGDSNVLLHQQRLSGFIDLGRSGKADRWYDIAFCVRAIREELGEERYVAQFFAALGIVPDWAKIRYYILLDELF